jgi:phage terminase large subunit
MSADIKVKATTIFEWLTGHQDRVIALVGGAGSSKSHSLAQLIISKAYSESKKDFLIIRKTMPSIRLTCYKLITALLNDYNLPYEINKSEMIITTPTGSEIIFRGLDDPAKLKSANVNYIWIEEATELVEEDYRQLTLRLRRETTNIKPNQIWLSCNPISIHSWVKKLIESGEAVVNYSTYKDNPFLSAEYTTGLEQLKNIDEQFYQIYTLGQWGELKGLVLQNWEIGGGARDVKNTVYGLDFGYTSPSALVEVKIDDEGVIWVDELLYQTHLTNPELIDLIKGLVGGSEINDKIWCDSAEPDRIQEMRKAGLNARAAKKDIIGGINCLRTKRIKISARSINLIDELRNYKYKVGKDGQQLEEPVGFADHAIDALRYAVYSEEKLDRVLPGVGY